MIFINIIKNIEKNICKIYKQEAYFILIRFSFMDFEKLLYFERLNYLFLLLKNKIFSPLLMLF